MKALPRPALVALLAPQRFNPSLGAVIKELGIEGPIATVTAGWQEREGDDRELDEHLDGRTRNLRLYARAETVFQRDAELNRAHRQRQADLRQLQDLYRLRLGPLKETLMALLQREGEARFLDPERAAAVEALRTLDAQHLGRVEAVHREFEARHRPGEREAVAREREEVAREIAGAGALCIAGGHVAILLNRLRLFGPLAHLGERPAIAWSAGAMCLAERVILFHDHPVQGAGNAEALEVGLGLAPGIVPLPHARRRLDLDQPLRVAAFARRFAPALCLPMDAGARATWDGRRWQAPPGTLVLGAAGALVEASDWAA